VTYLLDASDGAGTFSNVELVYGTRDTHVVYGKGFYEGPLLRRRVNGKCVLLLQSGYTQIPSEVAHFDMIEERGWWLRLARRSQAGRSPGSFQRVPTFQCTCATFM
jgi:hypothetical protein